MRNNKHDSFDKTAKLYRILVMKDDEPSAPTKNTELTVDVSMCLARNVYVSAFQSGQ